MIIVASDQLVRAHPREYLSINDLHDRPTAIAFRVNYIPSAGSVHGLCIHVVEVFVQLPLLTLKGIEAAKLSLRSEFSDGLASLNECAGFLSCCSGLKAAAYRSAPILWAPVNTSSCRSPSLISNRMFKTLSRTYAFERGGHNRELCRSA